MSNVDAALAIFRQKKILTVAELCTLLKCSTRTACRRLKAWQTYTSYNQNGRYYVLPEIPQFNAEQIWHYKGVYFSKHGTLQKTLITLVHTADAGLNVFEANQILGIAVHTFMSQQFIRYNNLNREKHKGVYIYYSKDPTVFSRQKAERYKLFNVKLRSELPTDAEAVILLVALIKNPNDNIEQLYRRARYKGVRVSHIKIRNLLDYHGLLKKTSAS